MTRVVCVQLAPVLGNVAANRALSTAAVRAAVDDGADVVVLPELATSGYVFTDTAEAAAAAISAEDPLFDDWAAEVARSPRPGTVVVGGFAETGPAGTVFNSAALLDASGVCAVYRKTHLWDREKLLFTPGDEVPPVVDTAHGRIGVIICYDLEFPEITRTLALGGADLIAVPTNWPLVGRPAGEAKGVAARDLQLQGGCGGARAKGTDEGGVGGHGNLLCSMDWMVHYCRH